MWNDRRVRVLGLVAVSGVFFSHSVGFAQSPSDEEAVASAPDELEDFDLSRLIDPEVRTASLVAEPVSEAPAPMTVITADMIESIGARNLQEVLVWFVPGMSAVGDKDELNVAMRGIYTDSQQKMLILVNGHRVNSRIFSSAAPDFSLGIHPSKIKQIEVLRGPGSALYGNLALNGVINIVTKSASDNRGASVTAGMGTAGQRTIHVFLGQALGDSAELTAWGSFFSADGDTIAVPAEEQYNKIDDPEPDAYFGAFKDPGSYDLGGKLVVGDFSLMLGARHGKMVPSYTSGSNTGGQTYDYDAFRSWNGVDVGFSSSSLHSELAYDKNFTKWLSFHTGFYLDTNATVDRGVIETRTSSAEQDVSTVIGWQERTLGNLTHLTLSYDFGAFGEGSFLVGGQVDAFEVIDSYWITGSSGDVKSVEGTLEEKVLPDGDEAIYSGFTQLKHAIGHNRDIIFNVGVRYDYKQRYDYQYVNDFTGEDFEVGEDIFAVSPRMAIILAPNSWLGAKFSFSDSFVDAPFFNRTNRTRNFRGSPLLEPENLRAYQFTPTIRGFSNRFRSSLNMYYLEHKNIIFRKKTLDPGETLFQNSGELVIGGVESETSYFSEDFRVTGVFSLQKPIHWTVYPVTDGQIDNVPSFFGDVIVDFKPLWWTMDNVWLGVGARYIAEQTSPVDIFYLVQRGGRGVPAITKEFVEPDRRTDEMLFLRASLRWKEIADTNFRADLTVDNILDTTYLQGGTTAHPYRQQGRWALFNLGYDLDI